MNPKESPPVITFLPTAMILMVIGWGGLIAVTTLTTPSGGTRWLFFFTGVVALTGTALLPVAFLNRRFPSTPPPTPMVILRQALSAGIYLPILAWMRIGDVLIPSLAVLLGVGLVLIEWLLRLRERSQWRPEQSAREAKREISVEKVSDE